MINALPGLNNAPPAVAGIAAASNPADTNSAPSASGSAIDAANPVSQPASAHQASFANTLQSRLKQIALNKAPVLPQVASPVTEDVALLPGIALRLATQSSNVDTVQDTTLMTALANTMTAGKKAEASKEAGSAESADPTQITDPGQANPTPLALNVVVPAPATPVATANKVVATGSAADNLPIQEQSSAVPTVQPRATPATLAAMASPAAVTPAATAAVDAKSRDPAGPSGSDPLATAPASQPAAPAILAATAEKTALPTASSDPKIDHGNFQEALSRSLAHTSANPSIVPANLPPIAAPAVRAVPSQLASAQWANDVGNQLTWMANQGMSHADLVLNPPELGRIEVSITVNGDQASASFVSGNPEVREALQGSLPRLREVLADAGVFLGQANIGAESFRQNQNGAEKGGKSPDDSFSATGKTLLGSLNNPVTMAPSRIGQGRGMIDLFA